MNFFQRGFMKRFLLTICAACLFATSIFSQENLPNNPENDTNSSFVQTVRGDQYLKISLAPIFPLNFPDFPSLFVKDAHQLSIGGIGNIGYHYFLNKYFAVGADVGFGFNVTIGSHVFNYVPVIATITFQPAFKKFEFPVTLGVGFAWESYSNHNYFPGLVVKPELGVHYRLAQSWSIGGDIAYMFMPQFMTIHKDKSTGYGTENIFGHFALISVSARYYF